MQSEIDGLDWPVEIRILGINQVEHESANSQACNGKDIPWLQETWDELVWGKWRIDYRDVVIVDQDNVPVATYNLTDNNLGTPANYEALKGMLEAAAR